MLIAWNRRDMPRDIQERIEIGTALVAPGFGA